MNPVLIILDILTECFKKMFNTSLIPSVMKNFFEMNLNAKLIFHNHLYQSNLLLFFVYEASASP